MTRAASGRDVVDVLKERGLLDACTEDELREAAASGSLSVYCGFDPTADSLHLGNLLGIIVLAWFQRCGHTPVALLGGATGRSPATLPAKAPERPVLDDATINANTDGIRTILEDVLRNSAEMAREDGTVDVKTAVVRNNLEWFGSMGFLEFLRDIGKYARVGTMMGKDSVKTRLESDSGMSFTEFSYQLLQGYDFCHLFKEHDVRVQVGGSDQWGNITAGTDLIRRIVDVDEGGRRKVARVRDHVPAVAQGKRPEVWKIRRGRGVAGGVAPFAVQVLPVHGAEHGRGCHPVHENADVHAHGGDAWRR